MKRKTLLLAVVLVGVMFAAQGFAQSVSEPKSDNNLDQQSKVKTIFSFKNEIGFTDDQELKLKAMLYDEQTLNDADNNNLKMLGNELGKLIGSKADMSDIKAKLEEIAQIQVNVSYRNIEDARKVETILSPDQIAKWRDIQSRFSEQSQK